MTASGNLNPSAQFFAPPDGAGRAVSPPGVRPLVYCASPAAPAARARLGKRAEVIDAGQPLSLSFMLADLAERSGPRVLLEGGAVLLREFLTAGLADELQLAVAPFFVGDALAPAFALPGRYPDGPGQPMTLAGVQRLGGVVALRYLLGPGGMDARFLRAAIELSRQCPPSDTAFSVGAILVSAAGEIMATGFSREQEPHDHAEEVALRQVAPDDPRLAAATIYTSLVPCGARASRPVTCVQHIIAAGVRAGRLRLARAAHLHRRPRCRAAPRRRHHGHRASRAGPGRPRCERAPAGPLGRAGPGGAAAGCPAR